MGRAVEVRAKAYPVFTHPAQVLEAEDLIPTAVSQNRAVPPHEALQPAGLFDEFHAGPQIQVIGVRQYDLGTDLAQLTGGHCLDRPLGCHRHERRSGHGPMSGGQGPETCLGVGVFLYRRETEHEGES